MPGRLACALLAGAALAGPAVADALADAVARFHSRDGGFSAHFPEPPRYAEKRETTLLGVLRTRSWEVERGGAPARRFAESVEIVD